jgi:DNA-binding MarR family transcriptional regulator
MKSAIEKLFQLRKALDDCERELGLNHLSEVERAIVSFVSSNSCNTITAIKKHPYFTKYSLSTLKRAVLSLQNKGIISSQQSLTDKREMNLEFNA